LRRGYAVFDLEPAAVARVRRRALLEVRSVEAPFEDPVVDEGARAVPLETLPAPEDAGASELAPCGGRRGRRAGDRGAEEPELGRWVGGREDGGGDHVEAAFGGEEPAEGRVLPRQHVIERCPRERAGGGLGVAVAEESGEERRHRDRVAVAAA